MGFGFLTKMSLLSRSVVAHANFVVPQLNNLDTDQEVAIMASDYTS